MEMNVVRSITVLVLVFLFGGCSVTGGGRYANEMCLGKTLCNGKNPMFRMSDGVSIPLVVWHPKGRVRAVVVASPGLDEAACELSELGKFLAARGCVVYSCDLRGQGRDRGNSREGAFTDWKRWIQDIEDVARFAHRQHPQAPLILAGQSTGGIAVLSLAGLKEQHLKLDGMVLQSPAVMFSLPPGYVPPIIGFSEILSFNRARFTTPAGLKKMNVSIMTNCRDEKAWEMSPDRVCKGFTYGFLNACFAMGSDTKRHLGNVHCPLLIQFGNEDPLLPDKNGKSANRFVSILGSQSKTVHWYRGSHDMLNDRNTRPDLLSDVNQWLKTTEILGPLGQ